MHHAPAQQHLSPWPVPCTGDVHGGDKRPPQRSWWLRIASKPSSSSVLLGLLLPAKMRKTGRWRSRLRRSHWRRCRVCRASKARMRYRHHEGVSKEGARSEVCRSPRSRRLRGKRWRWKLRSSRCWWGLAGGLGWSRGQWSRGGSSSDAQPDLISQSPSQRWADLSRRGSSPGWGFPRREAHDPEQMPMSPSMPLSEQWWRRQRAYIKLSSSYPLRPRWNQWLEQISQWRGTW